MIGVNVGLQDTSNLPPVLRSQVEIHLWVKRSVNHHRFILCTNEVRKAPFSCAPHLDDTDVVRRKRDFSNIPGQTPRLHPALQGQRLDPSCGQLLGCNLTGFASSTHGYNRSIAGSVHVGKRCWIVRSQGIIRINMDTPRNGPFCPFYCRTHIQDRDRASFFQPSPQGLDINGRHACPPVPLSTGSPSARQSGSPCSSRRALYPLVCSRATASSANTQ